MSDPIRLTDLYSLSSIQVRDPRELVRVVPEPPPEYGVMLRAWLRSEPERTENPDEAFMRFVKASNIPAAKVVLDYFKQ